jgi:hypothetical protein
LIFYVFCLSYVGCVNHNIFCILTYQSLDNMDKTTEIGFLWVLYFPL